MNLMDFILNPFVTILTLLYSIFNQDMVLAIIVFTILIRLVTYPLTAQQMKSSKAMQVLQPELKKLQEKYKNDREKLAAEQMRLYRENGVNPVGGCLPLLIQFPILIALYQAVIYSLAANPLSLIDLSGRLLIPGLGDIIPLENRWLGMNLSAPPDMAAGSIVAFALPVLVVVTTWLQFKVSTPQMPPSEDGKPNAAAATQQTMSTVMPLMYGFFALSFSVGLSVYFIASNVIGIVQYALMGKADFRNLLPSSLSRSPKPAAVAPTAPVRREPTKPPAKPSAISAAKPSPKAAAKPSPNAAAKPKPKAGGGGGKGRR